MGRFAEQLLSLINATYLMRPLLRKIKMVPWEPSRFHFKLKQYIS